MDVTREKVELKAVKEELFGWFVSADFVSVDQQARWVQ